MSDQPTNVSKLASWLKDLRVIFTAIAGTVALVIYFGGNEIAEYSFEALGLDELATAKQVADLSDRIEELSTQLEAVTGEDGFLIVRLRQSYVIEPVTQGELVTARYVMRRTQRGLDCTFISSTPLFRDIRDIGLPGKTLTPPIQLGIHFQRIEATYEMPVSLLPGRIELSLSLQYDCDGRTEFDEVGAMPFMLLQPIQ